MGKRGKLEKCKGFIAGTLQEAAYGTKEAREKVSKPYWNKVNAEKRAEKRRLERERLERERQEQQQQEAPHP